jgi:SAM-dependent methyltransferase/UDP-N-acetylglucosamine transferase subunit ALG13
MAAAKVGDALRRPTVVVTVGMGPWPFDRLLEAVRSLCDRYDVFAQTGTSAIELPCETAAFVTPDELAQRLASADVVITHAGNSVRLAQRLGRAPIAVAREAGRGEMGNDHQVAYLRREQDRGRVVAVWDVDRLAAAVAEHPERERVLVAERPLPAVVEPAELVATMDAVCADIVRRPRKQRRAAPRPAPGWDADLHRSVAASARNPFRRHPLRRYAFAWRRLAPVPGPHLDVGVGLGEFAGPLAQTTQRLVHGVDVHAAYVAETRVRYPDLRVEQVRDGEPLPYPDGAFASVSALDVLEHCGDEKALLAEVWRVLDTPGTLVVSVPRRHVFSLLDPDNAKYRFPRTHRRLYSARFGRSAYDQRFVDVSDGLRGDIAVDRVEHRNYRTSEALALIEASGLTVREVVGANMFWRLLQIPSLFGGRRLKAVLGAAIALDGVVFTSPRVAANLFVVAEKASDASR